MEKEIKIGAITLTVVGTYNKAEKDDHDTPGHPAEFDIEKVYYKNVDVFPVIDEIQDFLFQEYTKYMDKKNILYCENIYSLIEGKVLECL